jgi:hypothetical protein
VGPALLSTTTAGRMTLTQRRSSTCSSGESQWAAVHPSYTCMMFDRH